MHDEFRAFLLDTLKALDSPVVNGALVGALSDAYVKVARLAQEQAERNLNLPDFSHPDFHTPRVVYTIRHPKCGTYVGSTVRTFCERYPEGKWWEHTHCDRLRLDALVYGVGGFTTSVYPCESTDEMLELEARLIKAGARLSYNRRPEPTATT